MMFRRVVIVMLVLGTPHTSAEYHRAPPAQELEPVENALTYHTPEYPRRMRQVLFKRSARKNKFQFLSMPSFEPETLLTVRVEDNRYIAQVIRPEKKIWNYKDDDTNLNVSEREKRLPQPLAKEATRLWQSMLLRTKFQRRSMYLDGISYAFLGSAPGYLKLAAKSSNPEPGSRPALLAGIGELLIEYVETDTDGEKRCQSQMQELMRRLNNALNGETSNNRLKSTGDPLRGPPAHHP